jgi:hypothetical protein
MRSRTPVSGTVGASEGRVRPCPPRRPSPKLKPIPVWINKVTSLSDDDILELTSTNLPINRVRIIMASARDRIAEACRQGVKPGVIDARRIEFEAANEICRLFGEELK